MMRISILMLALGMGGVLGGCSKPAEPVQAEAPLTPQQARELAVEGAQSELLAAEARGKQGLVLKAIRENDQILYSTLVDGMIDETGAAAYTGDAGLARMQMLVDRALSKRSATTGDELVNALAANDLSKQVWFMKQGPMACAADRLPPGSPQPPPMDASIRDESYDIAARVFATPPVTDAKQATQDEILDWMNGLAKTYPQYAAALSDVPDLKIEDRVFGMCGLYLKAAEDLQKMPTEKRAAHYRAMAVMSQPKQ